MSDASTQQKTATAIPTGVAVAMHGITKRFPGVVANDAVDFEAAVGEVHALLGENGAGKSTLSNILTGLYRPDEGEIVLYGDPVRFANPREALDAGIGMVHQHFRLVETFTVAENMALGEHRPGKRSSFRIDPGRIEAKVSELSDRYGMDVDPRARVWQLSLGEQQRVEILKALYRDARVLILDEPTAVLTPQEADVLFATLRQMVADGRTVIFISHKLNEVKAVSDRVTVLRGGRSVATVAMAEATPRSLAALMVGRELADPVREARPDPGEPMLRGRRPLGCGEPGRIRRPRRLARRSRGRDRGGRRASPGTGSASWPRRSRDCAGPSAARSPSLGRSFTSATRRHRSAPESPSSPRIEWRPGRRPGSASPRTSCFAPTATRRSRAGRCSCSAVSASAPFA